MWYQDIRYPQVFYRLTVSQRDPWGLGCHSLVSESRYTIDYLGIDGHGFRPLHPLCIHVLCYVIVCYISRVQLKKVGKNEVLSFNKL